MKVKEIMTPSVEIIHPETALKDVASRMKTLDIGAIPVGEKDRLVGMVTDRDITVRSVAEGKDPNNTRAQDVMTEPITYCFENQDLEEAATLMKQKQLRRLVVLNDERRMVGMCTMADLVVHGNTQIAADVLHGVSQPAEPKR